MGVKSLWSLLTPVGRPVMLETIEGKAMAIDSSIWIYQFQATMRDKDGRALVNAHVLGFLRRICKLLFYGIKPVFVFDGGAPTLKRMTISERKKKKAGAAASHVKLAEKLLAAQMRREALNHAQPPQASSSKPKSKAPQGPVILDDDMVYLEDIDGSVPKTPSKPKPKFSPQSQDPSSTSSKKKTRFHDHDPYRLPELNLSETISAATRSAAPDPRLATEDELRAFIDEMRPEDFDVTSPAFRELPTEVQYEIVGDLRLKSRQTSYKRLQAMLQKAPTPLDFSRQQIKNLKQRNSLTQQLLMTTDSIGKAHLSIPIRIASERNKEYVLMKNEGEAGGWVLGIRDDGTADKPIEVDQDSDAEQDQDQYEDDGDSEMEMEEINIPGAARPDSDLREYQRGLALNAIDKRASNTTTARPSRPIQRGHKTIPLFDLDEDDPEYVPAVEAEDFDDDPELAFVLQESVDQTNAARSMQMTPSPRGRALSISNVHSSPSTSTSKHHLPTPRRSSSSLRRVDRDSDDEMYGSRLETALAIANTGPRRPLHISPHSSPFGKPALLAPASHTTSPLSFPVANLPKDNSDDDMEEVLPIAPATISKVQSSPARKPSVSPLIARDRPMTIVPTPQKKSDEINPFQSTTQISSSSPSSSSPSSLKPQVSLQKSQSSTLLHDDLPALLRDREASSPIVLLSHDHDLPNNPIHSSLQQLGASTERVADQPDSGDEEAFTDWSRSPSPVVGLSNDTDNPRPLSANHETWDAAQEMDPHAEEGEFARFMSQVKGRDLDDVRAEIDEEIKSLNRQKKAAMRDSDDITQQMISQIMLMLRLFGIPYITAPMEAEAQCAELVSLGLVEGIITDDSDVFLFGGLRVYKNMFNQSKTVECFFLSDLGRELGLDRDTLVRLAYLLGSDYVEGLPGVGPVVAMELLKEFPGEDGLHKFKDWWMKVQSGKDASDDNRSNFRKRFKKKFKDLYLASEWPNPAVRDAYYHPTVDESDEPFKWGLPDLDALRDFLRAELGWHQTKVDDLLLPIIQKMGKRGQAAAMNKQGNLNEFFDVSADSGTHAPRKRQAYSSKRLQQVVSEFRSEKAKLKTGYSPAPEESTGSGADNDADEEPAKKRRKTKAKGKGKEGVEGSKSGKAAGRGKGRDRGTTTTAARNKKATSKPAADCEEDGDEYVDDIGDVVGFAPQLRPRPKPKPAYKGKLGSDSDVDAGPS